MKDEYDFSKGVRGKYVGRVDTTSIRTTAWEHPSVRLLAKHGHDPMETIIERARGIVLSALDAGAVTIPIDPVSLARFCSVQVVPTQEVKDARVVAGSNGEPVIQYNPIRPRARVKFSICHELGHTLFPDWAAQVRNRTLHTHTSSRDLELEMMCNLAAAEFLLPVGSMMDDLGGKIPSIDAVLEFRAKYAVSTEAVLLRIVGLINAPCAVFAALAEPGKGSRQYKLEYVKSSAQWNCGYSRGDKLPAGTIVSECTAIGHTVKAKERWSHSGQELHVQVVGVPPYPMFDSDPANSTPTLPRVVGIIRPVVRTAEESHGITYLKGDALEPIGKGEKIVAHVVNDRTPNWGAGFGRAVQSKWPVVQERFREFFNELHGPKLGHTFLSQAHDEVWVLQMICQHGYGDSNRPLIRYAALRDCLFDLRETATKRNAVVHMPRIGAGQAGGAWGIISSLISEELSNKGVSVTIYDLPNAKPARAKKQLDLLAVD